MPTPDCQRHTAWGTFACPEGAPVCVAIGTLQVTFLRSPQDVTTRFEYAQDVFWNGAEGWQNEWRTVSASPQPDVLVVPACPPRNVVARPVKDLFIPPKAEVTIYVGYPAWLRAVAAGDVLLADLSTELMSQTWLGPNTRQGEVAFAAQTSARLSRDNLPADLHTIRVPVTIENASHEPLQVSRLSIPAPQLPTFRADERLWSAPVSIVCEATLSEASIDIGKRPPDFLDNPERLSDARVVETESGVSKAIGFLLG